MLSRYRAHGLLGSGGGTGEVWLGTGSTPERAASRAHLIASGAIVPVQVEGLRGQRYITASDEEFLDAAESEVSAGASAGGVAPQAAFLAPLDPLIWDRHLLRDLFGFDYVWEVYVPAPKRRWGYYVLPLLYGDRFVGRIEPRIDRKAGVLRVAGLWWEDGFDPMSEAGLPQAVAAAIDAHREFGGVARIELPRELRPAAFVRLVRAALRKT
jgi:uncharacterized protein YcaQ